MLRRFIAGLFLALSFSVVHAQSPAVLWETSTFNGTGQKYTGSSATEACAQYAQAVDAYYSSATYTLGNVNVHASGNSGSCQILRNGSTSGALGATVSKIGCQAGVTFNRTFFAGWTSSQQSGVYTGEPELPFNYCDGQCSATMDEVLECNSNDELSPNGYHEVTCTYQYKSTGTSCTTQTPDPDKTPEPAPPDPPDDGDPGDGDPGGPGDGDPGDPGDGEPGDGEPGDGEPGDGGGGGDCVPTENNPCDDGGPGGGSGGDGPGEGEDDGDEKGAECGVAGKPACSVKVDETGTASVDQLIEQVQDMHDYTAQLSGPNGEVQQMNDDLKNMNPGSVFGMNDWSWSFQLPTGCTPLVMADFNVTIDPCQWQSTIHDLMSMIWIISTFFGVLWIARGTF